VAFLWIKNIILKLKLNKKSEEKNENN